MSAEIRPAATRDVPTLVLQAGVDHGAAHGFQRSERFAERAGYELLDKGL